MTMETTQRDAKRQANALVEQLGQFVNAFSAEQVDAFATALANEHPTLLGQIAKAVGIGVMRRAVSNDYWRPFDSYTRKCLVDTVHCGDHAEHDGRLSCETVVGAELMARQGFI